MKIMKSYSKILLPVLGRALLAVVGLLALSTAQLAAGNEKSVPASILNKLDSHLALLVQQSRAESLLDKSTAVAPDVYKFEGRVLVQIEGSISRELSDQIASFGGQLVTSWGTATTFRAWVPFARVEALAGRADIKFISAARPSVTRRLRPH